ncbi:hypothetical protein G6F31_012997 [Rhizopus arrhizus]|nr:hypothetical protein G6F31_012997 [Rhizopus arrhizus]
MDRLVHLQRLRGQHRHQRAGGTVAIGDEVGQAGDAHPFHRQPAQRLATGHGDVRSHQQQSLRLPGQRPAVQRFRLVETKQGVLAQRCDRAWLAQPVQIGRAGHQPQPAAAQRPCMQGGIGQRPDPDRQVGASLQQIDVAVGTVQLQLHVRVALSITRHQWRDHVQHERHCRVHAQAPGRALAARRHLFLRRLHRIDDRARMAPVRLALGGQVQAAGGAGQQRGAQLVLQPPQRAAHARRRLPQLLGGGADRTAVDHRQEGLHFIKRRLHAAIIDCTARVIGVKTGFSARDGGADCTASSPAGPCHDPSACPRPACWFPCMHWA